MGENPSKPLQPRHAVHRATKLALEAVAVLVGGVIILAVVLAVRLSQGPIPLDFLSPYVVQTLKGVAPDADIVVGDTVLIWSETDTPQVRARDVHIHGPKGEEWASVPEVSVALSIPALFHGVLAPSGLEIYGLHVRLVRTADGTIQFGDIVAPPSPEAPVLPPGVSPAEAIPSEPWISPEAARGFVALLAGESDSSALGGYLKRVSMVDADFMLDDRKTGHTWRAPEVHLLIVRDRNGTVGRGTLAVDLNGTHPNLDVVMRYRPGDPALALDVNLTNLDPAALAAAVAEPVVAPLGAIEATLSGKAHAAIGVDGSVQSVAIEMDAGAGKVNYPRLGLGGGDQAALPINGAHLRAHVTDSGDRLAVDDLKLDLDGAQIALSGEATLGAAVPTAHIDVRTDSLPVATLIRYWPVGAVGHTREWMVANLKGGTAEDGHLAFDIGPAGPDQKLDVVAADGTFRFKDVAVTYFPPLPEVHGLSGTATLKTDSLTFKADGGQIQDLAISDGAVTITGLSVHDQDLAVEAAAQGPLRSALAILDNPRFGYVKALGINVGDVKGDAALRLRVSLPLTDALIDQQLRILANANLRHVDVPKAALGLDVSDGALSLVVDRGGLVMKGDAKVAGAPASLVWNENFGAAPAGFRRRLYFKGTLDDAARETAGLALEPEITGPVGVETVVTDVDSHRTSIDLLADLGASTLAVSDFGLEKKAGTPATAAVRATLSDGHLASLDQLEVRGEGIAASGGVRFTADGKNVQSASLSRIAFGETDVSVDASRDKSGVLNVRVGGAKLDAAPLINAGDDEPDKTVTPMTVDVSVGFVRLGKGGGANGVVGHLARDDKHWYVMTIDGTVGAAKPLAVRMSRAGTSRPFSVTADDAGAVLKALDVTGNVVGGTLSLSGKYDDAATHSPFKGDLQIRNFHVERAPLMAKVLSVASLTGVLNVLSGKGIDFSAFDATVTYVDGAAFTDNLRAHGSALGFTGRGTVNLRKNTIDLQGTVVPAYSVNAVLGNIPILGAILTGPEGGGVFAATYRMRGSLDDPEVTVNPLATLTPGFLRNLFNIFESAPQTAPPPTAPAPTPAPSPESSPAPPAAEEGKQPG